MNMSRNRAFTLIELLIVIFVIGILAAIVASYVPRAQERAKLAKATVEIEMFRNALELHLEKTGVYPDDVSRGEEADIIRFLKDTNLGDDADDDWPVPPWAKGTNKLPNGKEIVSYDYDAHFVYDSDGDGNKENDPEDDVKTDIDGDGDIEEIPYPDTVQISINFCPKGGPVSDCQFPDQPWITDEWNYNSTYYYCIKGFCRAHDSEEYDHPGWCVNCVNPDGSVGRATGIQEPPAGSGYPEPRGTGYTGPSGYEPFGGW